MAQGIILAGGFSSRTQNNKMRLSIDGKPLIFHTIEAMKPFVNKIYLLLQIGLYILKIVQLDLIRHIY